MANWANIERLGNPGDPNWQRDNLTVIEPAPGQKWQVYRPAAKAFQGLLGDLIAGGYNPVSGGGFNYRPIRGSNRLSQHAFGTAIDISPAANPRVAPGGALVTNLPANTADLAKKWGLEWGGNWSRPDAMHFEWIGDNTAAPVMTANTPMQSVPGLQGLFSSAAANDPFMPENPSINTHSSLAGLFFQDQAQRQQLRLMQQAKEQERQQRLLALLG